MYLRVRVGLTLTVTLTLYSGLNGDSVVGGKLRPVTPGLNSTKLQ